MLKIFKAFLIMGLSILLFSQCGVLKPVQGPSEAEIKTYEAGGKCYLCKGTGQLVCTACNGRSRVTCPDCGGSGKKSGVIATDIDPMNQCTNCLGSGDLLCPDCSGSGRVRCNRCQGTGKAPQSDGYHLAHRYVVQKHTNDSRKNG